MYPDLHRHLDGSLRPDTVEDLARRAGQSVPDDLRFSPHLGLQRALASFAFTLSLLTEPDAVRRVAHEICEDAEADGVTTLEIRFAPQLHGPDPQAFVEAAVEGIADRAGLILCGLYGEDPAVLTRLVRHAIPGVVGIDLAGGPTPTDPHTLEAYELPFRLARDRGMGRTVHAAEGRSPHEIRIAVEILGAQRIGHGTTILDDPAVVDLVLAREVTLEACPTSNLHTGVIPSATTHPLARWLKRGIKCCVNTDNTLFSNVTARGEHDRALALDGMSPTLLRQAIAHGHAAAFRR